MKIENEKLKAIHFKQNIYSQTEKESNKENFKKKLIWINSSIINDFHF